jgi:hypothetical protein
VIPSRSRRQPGKRSRALGGEAGREPAMMAAVRHTAVVEPPFPTTPEHAERPGAPVRNVVRRLRQRVDRTCASSSGWSRGHGQCVRAVRGARLPWLVKRSRGVGPRGECAGPPRRADRLAVRSITSRFGVAYRCRVRPLYAVRRGSRIRNPWPQSTRRGHFHNAVIELPPKVRCLVLHFRGGRRGPPITRSLARLVS